VNDQMYSYLVPAGGIFPKCVAVVLFCCHRGDARKPGIFFPLQMSQAGRFLK
jgi:hypothetical protein